MIPKRDNFCSDKNCSHFEEGSTSRISLRRQEISCLLSAKTSRKFRSLFDDAKVTSKTRGRRRSLLARALARDMGGRVRERARVRI